MIDIANRILSLRDQGHPTPEELKSFLADGLPRPRALEVVRHLLAGCTKCRRVTARLWFMADQRRRKQEIN